jgi:hypothetical protein
MSTVVLSMYKIIRKDSDSTLDNKDIFEEGRQIVSKETLFGIGGFTFLLSYMCSYIAKHVTTLKQLQVWSCLDILDSNFKCLRFCLQYHISVTNFTYAWRYPLQY